MWELMTDKQTQTKKFKELARELECDEDEKVFDRKLERVAKPRPSDTDKQQGKPAK